MSRRSEEQEERWDKLLKIKTAGRDDSKADQYHHPYEPTPYSVLERLANTGLIRKNNTLLDYGCGKGRVDYFLSYQTKCRSIGIEYDERIYVKAMENKEHAISGMRVTMEHADAEHFSVPKEVDCIYFFNPFTLEILQKVVHRIIDSYYENPRKIQIFFYYPTDEYISYLMTIDEMMFADEIDCRDLFSGNDMREKIVVFEIGFDEI